MNVLLATSLYHPTPLSWEIAVQVSIYLIIGGASWWLYSIFRFVRVGRYFISSFVSTAAFAFGALTIWQYASVAFLFVLLIVKDIKALPKIKLEEDKG